VGRRLHGVNRQRHHTGRNDPKQRTSNRREVPHSQGEHCPDTNTKNRGNAAVPPADDVITVTLAPADFAIARLARHFECPIHGIRSVRHPDGRLQVRVTEAIEPKRDAEGKIDVAGTMQVITSVVEGWVREHPEQWLWLHRWREGQSIFRRSVKRFAAENATKLWHLPQA